MDLWIMSQDKETLGKFEHFSVEKSISDDWVIIGDNGMRVINHLISDDKTVITADELGIYKSKERALEVLDEIEEKISLINTINLVKDRDSLISFGNAIPEEKISGLSYPYQMPKE